jgi:hypothetical protein
MIRLLSLPAVLYFRKAGFRVWGSRRAGFRVWRYHTAGFRVWGSRTAGDFCTQIIVQLFKLCTFIVYCLSYAHIMAQHIYYVSIMPILVQLFTLVAALRLYSGILDLRLVPQQQ